MGDRLLGYKIHAGHIWFDFQMNFITYQNITSSCKLLLNIRAMMRGTDKQILNSSEIQIDCLIYQY